MTEGDQETGAKQRTVMELEARKLSRCQIPIQIATERDAKMACTTDVQACAFQESQEQ